MRYDDDGWMCGFCGQRVSTFRKGDLAEAPYQAVMAWHAFDAHQVDLSQADRAGREVGGTTWFLPDGRVWMRRG